MANYFLGGSVPTLEGNFGADMKKIALVSIFGRRTTSPDQLPGELVLAVDVGEALIAALIQVGQLFVIES